MLKGAPLTCHQERSNHVTLFCQRAQFAPKPGGSPLALSEDAAFVLKDTVATKIDLEDASAARKVFQSWVGTLFVTRGSDLAYDIDMDAGKTVARTSGDKKGIDIKCYAMVEKIPGGMIKDSTGMKGALFHKYVIHPKTKQNIENPRILLFDCNLEYKQGESQTNVEIVKRDDFSKNLGQEETYSKKVCDEMTAFKPDRVITEKGVSDLAQHFVHKVGVTAVRRLRKSNNLRVARVYGPPITNRTEEIPEEDIGTGAGLFKVRKFGDKYFTSIEQYKNPKTCTILLWGVRQDLLDEVERAKAEAKAAKKGEAEDDENLDDMDEDEEAAPRK